MSWKLFFLEIKPPANPGALSDVVPLLKRLEEAFGTRPIARLLGVELAEDLMSVMPRNVCILRSKAQDFFTSDAPCAYFDPISRPLPGELSGIADFSSDSLELTLPLDRRHAALIANRPLPNKAALTLMACASSMLVRYFTQNGSSSRTQ